MSSGARELVAGNLAGPVVRDVVAGRAVVAGLPVMVVRIEATVPLLGLLGPTSMTVEGHALQEGWS